MKGENSAALEPHAGERLDAYQGRGSRSRALYDRAQRVMPGGNTRHSVALAPYPAYFQSARGCRVIDVEGEERIDFLNNYTSALHGHANEQVMAAVKNHLDNAASISMPSEHDINLAELLVERVPYIDRIRFCNSGSEAVLVAIKAARAYTGRRKIAKFEGAYHGLYDYAQVSEGASPETWGDASAPASVVEPGVSPGVQEDVVVLPWNRLEVCKALLEKHGGELAAILADPLPSAIGLISPREGFLEGLRDLARESGALFISDEVLTFRVAYDGACTALGIDPDLTTFGKVIGGGFPVGAVAGKAEIMAVFDHTGDLKVHHGGTFNANPITMIAGHAALGQMTREAYNRLNQMGDALRAGIAGMLAAIDVPGQVTGQGSLFCVHLTDAELIDFRTVVNARANGPDPGRQTHEMLERGIIISPKALLGCLSTPMTTVETDAFVDALRDVLVS